MTPGRLLWLCRHFLRHGWRGAYGREVLARRILRCLPLTGLTDPTAEVHVLTSRGDWLPLLWSLRTFYRSTASRFCLCIHEDGTLPDSGRRELARQFPDARIVSRAEADRRMADELADLPLCRQLRVGNPLLLKALDFPVFTTTSQLIVLDCDLVFFSRPDALLERIENPDAPAGFNRDWRYGYSVPWEELQSGMGPGMETLINSGLGVLPTHALTAEHCERFLKRFPSLPSHPHRIEQTLIALCACESGYEMLPAEYDVYGGATRFDNPVRHYSGDFRRLLFTEGLPHAWKHRHSLL